MVNLKTMVLMTTITLQLDLEESKVECGDSVVSLVHCVQRVAGSKPTLAAM